MPTNLALNDKGQPYWEPGADQVRVVADYDGTPMWAYVGEDLDGASTLTVDRSVDDGQSWEPVGESAVGSTFQDFQGLSNGTTQYRATITTGLGVAATTETIALADSDGAWIGKGPSYGDVAALRHVLHLTPTTSLVHQSLYHFSGKRLPDEISGEALSRTIGVSGTLFAPRLGVDASTAADFDRIASTPGTVCYRDTEGRRWYGALSGMTTPQNLTGVGNVSYTVTQTNPQGAPEVDFGDY